MAVRGHASAIPSPSSLSPSLKFAFLVNDLCNRPSGLLAKTMVFFNFVQRLRGVWGRWEVAVGWRAMSAYSQLASGRLPAKLAN